MHGTKLISSVNERGVGNKQIPTPNSGGCAGRFVPGVSSKRYPFIFDWHQGRILPTPACGITPNTQKSESYIDAVDQGGTGNVSEEKNCDSERKGDNVDDYPW